MRKSLCIAASAALLLASCATGQGLDKLAQVQADFDKACKYATGVVSAAQPILPLVQNLLLIKVGEEAALAFSSLLVSIDTTCSEPLDLANASDVVQRVYDAGGKIVALVIQSQAQA